MEQRRKALISVDDCVTLDDWLAGFATVVKKQGADIATQNGVTLERLLTQRLGGLFLKAIPRAQGRKKTAEKGKKGFRAVLHKMPLSPEDAARWQHLTKKTEAEITAFVDEAEEQVTMPRAYSWAVGALHFSSDSEEWYTPESIIERTIALFGSIDLDPCSNGRENPNVPATRHFTKSDNGLSLDWFGNVYMNPPYGREIDEWVKKAVGEYESSQATAVVALVPSRTDTVWFRALRQYARCFISGRLKFSGHDNSAPFPSMVAYLGPDIARFVEVFAEVGDIYGLLEEI